jgi:hypothetical protein
VVGIKKEKLTREAIREMDMYDKIIYANILARSLSSSRLISHKQRVVLYRVLVYLNKLENEEVEGLRKYATMQRIREYVEIEMRKLMDDTIDKILQENGVLNVQKLKADGCGYMVRKSKKTNTFEKAYKLQDTLKMLIALGDGLFWSVKEIASESAKKFASHTFYKIRISKRGIELLNRWNQYIIAQQKGDKRANN